MTLEVTSVSVEPQGSATRVGWNAGDRVTIRGQGFTPHDNHVYCTDGDVDSFLVVAPSVDGTEISFLLPEGFSAPHGTGLAVRNANGRASTVPAGERRNY